MTAARTQKPSTEPCHSPARIALVGCGLIARGTHIPGILDADECELVWLCDIDEKSLGAAAQMVPQAKTTTNFHDVFADPAVDLVLIATSHRFRLPLFEAAVRHNKPIYSEKPLAESLEDCRQAVHILEEAGIPFCIGHNRRCSPAMAEARAIIQRHRQNTDGCPWRFNRPGYETIEANGQENAATMLIRINDDWHSWKAQHLVEDGKTNPYAAVLHEMTHFVDLGRWFLESPATRVMGLSDGPLGHTVSVSFADKSQLTIVSGANGTFGYPKELLEISANGGFLALDHMFEMRTAGIEGAPGRKIFPVKDNQGRAVTEDGLKSWLERKAEACREAARQKDPMIHMQVLRTDKGHQRMLLEFIREIRGERPPVTSARDAYEAARICFAAIESIQTGRTVDL